MFGQPYVRRSLGSGRFGRFSSAVHHLQTPGTDITPLSTRFLSNLSAAKRVDEIVSPAIVDQFERDGAVCLRNVFGKDTIESLRASTQANMEKSGPLCDEHSDAAGSKGRFHDDQFLWLRHKANEEYMTNGVAAGVAASMMRSNSGHLLYDHLLVKEPGTVAPTPYHNDMSYWHLRGHQICSLWLALDDVAEDAGIAYVAGSHHWRLQHAITNFSGEGSDDGRYGGAEPLPQLTSMEAQIEADNVRLLRWGMKAGDVLVHHGWAVHGAPGNPNKQARRRGYATRWVGDDMTLDDRPGTMRAKWEEKGFKDGLSHGSKMGCKLHPNFAPRRSFSTGGRRGMGGMMAGGMRGGRGLGRGLGHQQQGRGFSTERGVKEDAVELARRVDKDNVRFVLFSFVDLFGAQRAKLVPACAVKDIAKNGAGFAGFAAHFDLCPSHSDVLAFPDLNTYTPLPWKPEVAWVATDLYMQGKPLEQSPRLALQRQIAKAAEKGFILKTGVEPEFMLLDPEEGVVRPADSKDTSPKPCYDQIALMRRYDLISQVSEYMEALGWGPYQNDHEDANGQFEMNWNYDDALVTADRQVFFKFMVKTLAEQHGLRATFMPKPMLDKTGNGAHLHLSLHSTTEPGEPNLFKGEGGELLSPLAYTFLGGLIQHAPALTAIANPTINSYKRLSGAPTDSGSTWAPTVASHGGNDRTHAIRVPDAPRLELRLGDMAANAYLYPAAVLAAGLNGVETKADPGPSSTVPAWELPEGANEKLPTNLLDSLRAFEANGVLGAALGSELSAGYVALRMKEWQAYSAHLTQFELDTTLDC